ncbi:MAG: GTP 3',8-cyclase MoaA [SAR202 cluster bacterium]|nr:GTP 3',8-cyclase MoaA [SAR202 cluster bacterium]
MPAEIFGERYEFLPKPDLLTFEEITRLTRMFVGMGAAKVRLTGGEPLVRNQVETLVGMLAKIEASPHLSRGGTSSPGGRGESGKSLIPHLSPERDILSRGERNTEMKPAGIDLTMTTNGYLLAQKAQALKDAGLHRVTVSLDSLDDAVFRKMNGRSFGTERVLAGIAEAERVGLTPIKINSVVQRGVNDHTIVDLAKFMKDRGHILRFIEYMDVGTRNDWKLDQVVTADEIVARIDAAMPLEPIESNYWGEVALRFRYRDGGGEIGIIASVTKPFCGDCTRLRLSPEGKMYTCLFAGSGVDLRGPMRAGATDSELREIFMGTWRKRDDRYSEERTSLTQPRRKKVEMYHIGG